MMLGAFDLIVLVVYFVGVAAAGLLAGGRQRSTDDYFLGGRDLPWWAACLSVVATETSTLTVIGVPAVAYGGSMVFLQLAIGYLIGRVVVAAVLLPRYFEGQFETVYGYLERRFGIVLRRMASVTFLVTRLLADGVRLFATAIPLKVVAGLAGVDVGYGVIIAAIALVTALYTLVGGLRAVVWMDVVQMILYVVGAVVAILLIGPMLPEGALAAAREAGKFDWIDLSGFTSFRVAATEPYTMVAAVLGGAVLSMASHGTDQLVVQRLLACRGLSDARKALIGSGFVVGLQFAVFLVLGVFLWAFYGGAPVASLGLDRADEIFPLFIVTRMPPGLAGLLLAGILAAAMSTLSSSLNALASSTLFDLGLDTGPNTLRRSRIITMVWAVVFVLFANMFTARDNAVVELGLAIASFTYGALLGAFLLGALFPKTGTIAGIVSFVVALAGMILVVEGIWIGPNGPFIDLTTADAEMAARGFGRIAWPWYTVIGTSLSLVTGAILRYWPSTDDPDTAARPPTTG